MASDATTPFRYGMYSSSAWPTTQSQHKRTLANVRKSERARKWHEGRKDGTTHVNNGQSVALAVSRPPLILEDRPETGPGGIRISEVRSVA